MIWGAHAPSRAGDGALAIANFFPEGFRRGAEIGTRGRVRSPAQETETEMKYRGVF